MDNGQEQRRAVETAPGGYRPAGAPTGPGRLPALALCAALVALAAMFALVPAALFVERATAQEPTPEAGDAAEERQDQQECLIEPGQWFCPPPPPSGLSLRLSGEDIYVNYSRSYWETHTSHYYKFTLYRSSSRNGTYSSYRTANDTFTPALFLDVAEGYWYKARGVRCPSSTYTGCGDWSRYSSPVWVEVPVVPPEEPDDVEAEGRYRSVHVEWDSPSDNGGASVSGYRVQHRRSGTSSWSQSGWLSRYSTNRTVTVTRDNTRYEVQVQARNSAGDGDWSSSEYATTATTPSRVSRPGASEDGAMITVSWSAPFDGRSPITGYEIQYRRASRPSWEGSRAATGTSRSYTFTGLEADTRYEFQVRARNRVGNGSYSLSVYDTTDDYPGRMSAPDVTAGDRRIEVRWSPPSSDGGTAVTGYRIQHRRTSSSSWSQSSWQSSNRRSYTITGLTNGVEYEVQVRARNKVGDGDWSASSDDATPADEPDRVATPDATEDDESATITWDEPDDNGSAITGYRVQHRRTSPANGRWTLSRSWLSATSDSYTISGLDNGVEYEAQVKARNAVGEGAWSSSIEFTPEDDEIPPVSVPSLELVSTTESSITIRWDGVVGGYRYEVQRRVSGAGPWEGPYWIGSRTSYTAYGLDSGTRHDFQVRARGDGDSYSAEWTRWSSTLSASTDAPGSEPPSVPTNGSATVSAIDGSLVLSWSESDGATRYEVRIENADGASVYSDLDVSGSPHSISAYSLAGLSNPQTASVKACNSSTSCSAELDISFLPPAPAPTGMTSPVRTRTTVGLRWNDVASTTGYEHDYQLSDDDYDIWLDVPDSTTFTSRTVIHLTCGHGYFFRVRSHGDGSAYHSQWGPWSNTVSAFTAACNEEPEFEEDSYTFRAATDAETGAIVGTVEATDDEEVVSYTLTGSPLFSISKNADGHGEIAVAGSLADREGDAVLLTAKATDAEGLYDTVVVTVDVSATAPDSKATAPDATLSSATGTSVTIEWTAVEGVTKYRAQHKPAVEDDYTGNISVRTSLSYTATGLSPGESYDFRLSAHGDGSTYIDGWGDWSEDFTFDTADPPPADDCLAELGTVSGETSRSGEWIGACDSTNRPGRHARYYTFTLASAAAVTIELASTTQILNPGSASTDTYLFLLEGAGTSGTELARNDDSRDNQFGYYNSRIVYEAAAGTYTAEATTYRSDTTGSFDITVRPVFETPPDPPPVPTNGSAVWNASAGDLELSWTGSDEASTYQVRISAAEYTVRNIRRESYEIRASVILGLQYSQTALVRACDDRNTCSDDLEIEFLPPIPAPDNFRVAGSRSTEIDLAWDAVEHRAGYEHDYKESSSTRWLSVDLSTRLTSRTVTGLACGTRYDFRMRTAGGSGTPYSPQWGPWSDIASGSTAACDPTNEFPPLDSPTAEAAADGGSIDVAFRLPSAEFKYLLTLYRSADGKSYSPHLTPVELDYGDASPHTFSGLVPSAGGWYQARLKACREDERTDCGEPAYSNVVTLPEPTTNRPPAFDRTSYSFTAASSATVGTSVGTAAATDEDGTVASYSLDDASRFAISSSGEISVGASLTGLAGTSVTLTLTATDDDGATASVEIEIRVTAGSLPPADAPGSLVLNHPGDTFIVVEWHASAHAAEYAIEMLRSGAWERTEGITDEYHVFEHLSPGTEYRFRVQAKGDGVNRNDQEWSEWSETLIVSTTGTAPANRPGPPTNVRVVPGNLRLVVLWDPPETDGGSPITGYKVARNAGSQESQTARAITDPTLLGPEDRGFVFLNLDNGTAYSVTVKAVSGDVDGTPATSTATPLETTITVTAPDELELAASADVGVQTTNTAAVAGLKLRFSINDATKISINGCDPQDAAEQFNDLTSTATVQACAVGVANVTAQLVVTDDQGRDHALATSTEHEVTVTTSTATLSISGITGSDSLLTAGTAAMVTLTGDNLLAGKSYDFSGTMSGVANNALGFGVTSTCEDTEDNASATAHTDPVRVRFFIHPCKPSTDVTFTASLELDGVLLATATQVIKARPKLPLNLRAVGHSPTSVTGRVTLRVDNPGYSVQYEVQTAACIASRSNGALCEGAPLSWDEASGGPHTSTNVSLTVPSIATTSPITSVDAHEIVIDSINLDDLYRVRVKAVFGGDDDLDSEYTADPVMVYTTDAQTEARWVASVERKWYWTNRAYRATICTNLFSADTRFVPAIKAAMVSWQEELDWVVSGQNNTGSRLFSFLNPHEKNNCAAPTMASPGGTTEISMPSSITDFQEICDARMEPDVVACVLHAREDASNFVARVKAPMYFRPPSNMPSSDAFDWFAANKCTLFLDVATHEFGHVVGLYHSTSQSALMYREAQSHCDPTPMDVAAAVSLYQTRAQ